MLQIFKRYSFLKICIDLSCSMINVKTRGKDPPFFKLYFKFTYQSKVVEESSKNFNVSIFLYLLRQYLGNMNLVFTPALLFNRVVLLIIRKQLLQTTNLVQHISGLQTWTDQSSTMLRPHRNPNSNTMCLNSSTLQHSGLTSHLHFISLAW